MRALMWFRSDLRVADNMALWEACWAAGRDRTGGVVAVFLVSPEQWQEHDDAPVKVEFRLRNLAALSDGLDALRIPLKVLTVPRFADAPASLERLARDCDCDALFFNREYEWNERRRDREVSARFLAESLDVFSFDDAVVLPPGSVLTGGGTYYSKFTPFKRRWLDQLDARGLEVLPRPEPCARIEVARDAVPVAVEGLELVGREDLWPAGEGVAHQRLATFAEQRLGSYHERRDLPAGKGTSTLSPYLAAGVLSPRQCLHVAMNAGSSHEGRDTWISELVWREFYKHLLVGYPRLSKGRAFRQEYETVPWSDDEEAFAAWCEGRTGYPLVDAGMRQLLETGWMHNRVRMVVAMFLTKHLLIDWRWGERHFMRHLVDGDLAANNGGWQWSASTGTDAQPYFRVFNPWSQSSRFDPEGVYVRRYVPELTAVADRALHDPGKLAAAIESLGLDYPPPLVEHKVARERAIAVFKAVRVGA